MQVYNGTYDGMKIFSETKAKERDILGEKITKWIKANDKLEVVNTVITQSSDSEFHCLTVTVFYKGEQTFAEPMNMGGHSNQGGPRVEHRRA